MIYRAARGLCLRAVHFFCLPLRIIRMGRLIETSGRCVIDLSRKFQNPGEFENKKAEKNRNRHDSNDQQ